MNDLKDVISRCKAQLPMPELLKVLGMESYAKKSCRSPFREDKEASWGIFERDGHWFFKDHATSETGDEITLLAIVNGWNPRSDFKKRFSVIVS